MAHYVDGYVLSVPKKKLAAYKKMASEASKMWMRLGALHYVEAVADDMRSPYGTWAFPKMAKTRPTEIVIFAYIEYKSRASRDAIMRKLHAEMNEAKEKHKEWEMPFDLKRMAYGGFSMLVER